MMTSTLHPPRYCPKCTTQLSAPPPGMQFTNACCREAYEHVEGVHAMREQDARPLERPLLLMNPPHMVTKLGDGRAKRYTR